MSTKPMQRDMKVYQVNIGSIIPDKENQLQDCPNMTRYRVMAFDVELAIKKARQLFKIRKCDYIESVEKLATLDE